MFDLSHGEKPFIENIPFTDFENSNFSYFQKGHVITYNKYSMEQQFQANFSINYELILWWSHFHPLSGRNLQSWGTREDAYLKWPWDEIQCASVLNTHTSFLQLTDNTAKQVAHALDETHSCCFV